MEPEGCCKIYSLLSPLCNKVLETKNQKEPNFVKLKKNCYHTRFCTLDIVPILFFYLYIYNHTINTCHKTAV